jgi:ABC-type nitrate/sulfonate/bicarbonate transport system permease component
VVEECQGIKVVENIFQLNVLPGKYQILVLQNPSFQSTTCLKRFMCYLVVHFTFSMSCLTQMWLIIGFIVAVILAIIIGVAVSYAKSGQASTNSN